MVALSAPSVSKLVEMLLAVSLYHTLMVLAARVAVVGYPTIERELVTEYPIEARVIQHESPEAGALESLVFRQNALMSVRAEFAVIETLRIELFVVVAPLLIER